MAIKKRVFEQTCTTGDVVTLQDRIELMTVEGVRNSAFGVMLDCCWFDQTDGLRYGRFPAKSLDAFPKPTGERAIRIGTEVRLRSRGPIMSVRGFRTKSGHRYAICVWTGPMDRERQRMFPVECLTLTMLETFQGRDGVDY